MTKKGKYSLIHGIINILLPFVMVIISKTIGVLAQSWDYNAWEYFYIAVSFVFLPFISSLAGIIISAIMLIKAKEKYIKYGLAMSAAGFILQLCLRFVIK